MERKHVESSGIDRATAMLFFFGWRVCFGASMAAETRPRKSPVEGTPAASNV